MSAIASRLRVGERHRIRTDHTTGLSRLPLPLGYALETFRLRCYLAHALTLERDRRVTRWGKSAKRIPTLTDTLTVRLTATLSVCWRKRSDLN